METKPNTQSSMNKVIFGNGSQTLSKRRYQTLILVILLDSFFALLKFCQCFSVEKTFLITTRSIFLQTSISGHFK